LQYASETRGLIEKFNPAALKIVPQYDDFCVKVDREDLCFKVIRKSNLSEAKENADQLRDAVIVGIGEAVRTAVRHFDPAVSEAAKRLKIVLDAYNTPKPLTQLPYDAETVSVANLLQEFDGKYAADVQTTGLTPWVTELRARNDEFDRLAKAYHEQQAEKPPFKMKDVRDETDDAYRKITLVINALIVMEGETEYAPFVTELNELIKHYSDLIAQHRGRNKAKNQSKNENDVQIN
jgi:alpha-beta hydrolase superfamily lysophospholipase